MATFSEDELAIARRRKIAEALMAQGMAQDNQETVGGFVVPVSPLQPIAKIAQAIAGKYIETQADKRQAEVNKAKAEWAAGLDANAPDFMQKMLVQYPDKLPDVALAMAMAKAKAGGSESYIFGHDLQGNPIRLNKTKGTGGRVPLETGEGFLEGSIRSPEAQAAIAAAKQGQDVFEYKDEQGRTRFDPVYKLTHNARNYLGQGQSNSPNNNDFQGKLNSLLYGGGNTEIIVQPGEESQADAAILGSGKNIIEVPPEAFGVQSAQSGQSGQNGQAESPPDSGMAFGQSLAEQERIKADAAIKKQMEINKLPPTPLQAENLAIDKAKADADRAKAEMEQAKIKREIEALPPNVLKMQQEELEALDVGASGMADLKALIKQVEDGNLSFGPIENISNNLKLRTNSSDPNALNYGSFINTLEKLRNDSLLLSKGVQTEGDAERALTALVGNLNSNDYVKKRLNEIALKFERDMGLREARIKNIRDNYKLDMIDLSNYKNKPPIILNGTEQAPANGEKPIDSLLEKYK